MAVMLLCCGETQAARKSTSLQVVKQQVAGVSMRCDISTGKARPVVPACNRWQVFATLHSLVHPGIRASLCHHSMAQGCATVE